MRLIAPDTNTLSRAYYELSQLGASASGAKEPWPYHPKDQAELLALCCDLSRYDPRLFGILVEFFLKHWRAISPQALRGQYAKMETPQTIAVLAEFLKEAETDPELRYFAEYLQRGLKPVPFQLFYRDLYAPGGKLSQRSIEESLAEFKRWGFLSREAPTIDVFQKISIGSYDADSRRNILRKLFSEKGELRLNDYLQALRGGITRQQALKDLQQIARLRGSKRGPGARWALKRSK